jgi:type II secretory pathway pseudopilin PulG
MAKRSEEKERRRLERIAAEEAARRSAARKRTLMLGAGAVAAIALIGLVAALVLAGGSSSGSDSVDTKAVTTAATAAGCTFKQFPVEGRTHTTGKVTYRTNPPTSGNHNPTPAQDGFYAKGNTPAKENYVHALEHGRIEFQYKPSASAADIAKLRSLAEESLKGTSGYHVLLFENNTDMPDQFAATAWTRSISCPTLDAKSIAAMRAFRKAFTDKGPEFIP